MKFFKEKNLFQVIYEGKEGYVITNEDDIFTSPIGTYYLHIEDGYKFIAVITENTCLGGIKSIWPYYKIIASTFPLGDLPQFVIQNKNSEDELETVVKEYIGMNPNKEWDNNEDCYNPKNREYYSFKDGWNKHAEKYKFTEEDVKKAIQLAREANSIDGVIDLPIVLNYPNVDNSDLQIKWTEEEIIQFLQQPKEIIEIEFETEEYAVGNYGLSKGEPTIDTRLKITKSVKYPQGLLIIKNVKYG